MGLYSFIQSKLQENQQVYLLHVVQSTGSSPGRKDFQMAIASDGRFEGTIGGGIMEHKLVELARHLLQAPPTPQNFIKYQHHHKQTKQDQSGMICSGHQTIAFIYLSPTDLPRLQTIQQYQTKQQAYRLQLQASGIRVSEDLDTPCSKQLTGEDWIYESVLGQHKRVHIFGGGHVGLAVSQVLYLLNYHIHIYDDRPNLNTLQQNQWAHQQQIIDYSKIKNYITFSPQDAVVIVTFGYRSDKVILTQLYQEPLAYIGMMGSDAKIAQLYQELSAENIDPLQDLKHVHAPIGVPILSKTTMEIAISIAAQMIEEANKHLPTGRKK